MRRAASISLAGMLLVCAAAGPAPATEEYPQVEALVRPEKATVGSSLEYVLSVSGADLDGLVIGPPEVCEYYPAGKDARGERSPAAAAVPLYAIHTFGRKEHARDGKRYITLIINLAYYRAGRHRLPKIDIQGADGVEIGYRIPEVLIEEKNPAGEFQEIEPPLELGGNYYRLLIILAGAGLLLAGACFLFRWLEGRRAPADIPVPPGAPPLEEFLAAMQTLRGLNLDGEGAVELCVVEASRHFRLFVSRLFQMDAMEMTDLELAASLERALGETVFQLIRDDYSLLTGLWNLAKFAEFTPSASTVLENLELAMGLGRKIDREKRLAGL